jgi:ribonuclease D
MAMTNSSLYFKTVEAEYVKSLPVKIFPGTIHLVDHPRVFNNVKDVLLHETIIGFDTETKPCFKKGRYHPVALLQLSTGFEAFLIRLNKVQLPGFLIEILESKDIVKVGVALRDDLIGLKRIMNLDPDGFIDLQQFVKQFGIEDNGLKKLVANARFHFEKITNIQLGAG